MSEQERPPMRRLANGTIEELRRGQWIEVYAPDSRSEWREPPPPRDAQGRILGPDGKVIR